MDRRIFLQRMSEMAAAYALSGALPTAASASGRAAAGSAIDRRALVARHDPRVRAVDPWATLSVGNGRFAFSADVTGLQSFPEAYRELPLATQSQWGWHTFPNPNDYRLEQALAMYDAHGRQVPYASLQNAPAGTWLRQSPHRLSLARIGFDLRKRDGSTAAVSDLQEIDQRLDLWTGTLQSRFRLDGRAVRVWTWAHPERDLVAVRVEAPDFAASQLGVRIAFSYGSDTHTGDPADWTEPERHRTAMAASGAGAAWRRQLDGERYFVRAASTDGMSTMQEGPHSFRLAPAGGAGRFELMVEFSPEERTDAIPDVEAVSRASAEHWQRFWTEGGAIDLGGSADPRAGELERRIVLSQYLTAVNGSGELPPQETGLTFNSWFGKAHLEMTWWHAAHFALWNRTSLLEQLLPWYRSIMPRARETARRQGYRGVRWPKMIGPDGRESPSGVGVFLIWQQPHPIYFAELVHRSRPEDRQVLLDWQEVVFETAEFMASFAHWDAARNRYVLGPPLIPAQELHPPRTTFNPTFELEYWVWALGVAQRWRERLGLPREESWDRVIRQLSPLPTRDGLYTNAESDLNTFHDLDKRRDHPTLLAAYGFVPPQRADRETMRRTLHRVMSDWQWHETWGWDYPLVAMTAARLGEPEIAVDALLMDEAKNRYHPNGHNYQRPGLTIYLPGNGGTLYATAMMAAGWDGAPAIHAPGFPRSGWSVQWENLRRAP